MNESSSIKKGLSTALDPESAVTDLWLQLNQPDLALVIIFCSKLRPGSHRSHPERFGR